jgi:asparagine synthase (glutamine-hydrolysing)
MPQTARKYSADYLLRKFTEGAAYPSEKSHYWWRTIFTDEDKRRLFASGEAAWQKDSFLVYKAFYDDAPAGWSFTDKSLYADFFLFCNENANMMMDNLSMSFSLELRPPFLTKRFVEFAFKVPYRFKLKGAATKYCLRKAYEGRLPRHIVAGKKSGLVSPVSQLIQGPLKDAVRDTFAASARLNYFNKPYLDRMLAEHLAGRQDHGYQIYLIFTFMRWHSIFMEGGLPASSIRGAL